MNFAGRRRPSCFQPLVSKIIPCYNFYEKFISSSLHQGQNYDKLTQTYIIFICPFDLFNEGRYIYTFRKLCIENKNLELDDKATVIVLNAFGKHGNITKSAKNFLHYVKNNVTVDKLTQEISAEITKIKENQKVRLEYMKYEIKMWDLQRNAYDKGLERGRQESAIESATRLKERHNMSDEEIADITNLTLAQVKAIRV